MSDLINKISQKKNNLLKQIDAIDIVLMMFSEDKAISEKDSLKIEFLNNDYSEKQKRDVVSKSERQKFVFDLIVKINRAFTVKELQDFHKKDKGESESKEANIITNAVNVLYLDGKLRRYKVNGVRRPSFKYGLVDWFQSGTLIKEQYR